MFEKKSKLSTDGLMRYHTFLLTNMYVKEGQSRWTDISHISKIGQATITTNCTTITFAIYAHAYKHYICTTTYDHNCYPIKIQF